MNEAQRHALEAIDRQTVRLERFLEGFEFAHPPAGTVPTLPQPGLAGATRERSREPMPSELPGPWQLPAPWRQARLAPPVSFETTWVTPAVRSLS